MIIGVGDIIKVFEQDGSVNWRLLSAPLILDDYNQ